MDSNILVRVPGSIFAVDKEQLGTVTTAHMHGSDRYLDNLDTRPCLMPGRSFSQGETTQSQKCCSRGKWPFQKWHELRTVMVKSQSLDDELQPRSSPL